MVIGNCGGFTIAGEALVGELDDKGGLVGFGPAGDGEGVAKGQVKRMVIEVHGGQISEITAGGQGLY